MANTPAPGTPTAAPSVRRRLAALLYEGVLLFGVVLAWLFNQLLTAAAVEILDPGRESGKVRLWRTMVDSGWCHLRVYLRISLFALVFLALGGRVLSGVFDRLNDWGVVAGWTGKTLVYTLPIVHLLLLLAWAGVVGACAWWSRVIIVRGGRRYVRRLLTEMERCVQRSRKTLLVLTKEYLSSEWCEFENLITQTLDPGARQRRRGDGLVRRLARAAPCAGGGLALAAAHAEPDLVAAHARRPARETGCAVGRVPSSQGAAATARRRFNTRLTHLTTKRTTTTASESSCGVLVC